MKAADISADTNCWSPYEDVKFVMGKFLSMYFDIHDSCEDRGRLVV